MFVSSFCISKVLKVSLKILKVIITDFALNVSCFS